MIIALSILLVLSTIRWAGHIQLEFVLASIVVVLIPGIGVLFTVSTAISGGKQRGLIAAFGCTLGIIPHLIVAFLGLSGLMQLGSYVFEIVRWAGVLYLAWIGVAMIRENGTSDKHDDEFIPSKRQDPTGAYRLVARAVLINLLNPKLTLFFFAFLPQFLTVVSPSLNSALFNWQLAGLASLFMLLTLWGFVLYALLGAAVRTWLGRKPSVASWIQRSLGVVMLGLAARLAVTER
jgi:threonine/homoserine/homoserine lactone efflux protein